MSNIELLNIDCMEYMAGLPDKAFDLAIVDPPYGIKQDGRKNHTRGKLAKAKDYQKNSRYDNSIPDEIYFNELNRVSKNQIIWGGNYFLDYLNATNCLIVWDKVNQGTDFADCEIAWTSFKTAVRMFSYMWNGMMQGSDFNGKKFIGDISKKENRIHPNQKPIKLYKWLLQEYGTIGCRILDTHLGSGSIAIACHQMGFDLVGCEIDKDYYDAAVKRFNEAKKQQTLFQY